MKKWMTVLALFLAAVLFAEEFEMTGTLKGTGFLRVEGEKQVNLGTPAQIGSLLGDFKHGDQVHVKVEGKWNPKNPDIFMGTSVLSLTEAK